jgi:DNA-binding NarL/FixJ family response regulator
MKKIMVLIVDDHTLVREGIRSLLTLADDIEIIGEATNGEEAIEKAKELLPDVVLMDLAMPITGGLEAMRRISKELSATRVLVLTQYDDPEYVIPAIAAGARGFVTKMTSSSELTSAIHAIYRGESFLSPSAATTLIEGYKQKTEAGGDPYYQLTDREREMLKLIAEGHTIREIADMLLISPKTAEWHKSNLMNKLNIHNRTDLIKFAIRKAIIMP